MPKPSKSSKSKPPVQQQPSAKPPSWPPFKPPLPVAYLQPEYHPQTQKIALISSFFPRSLCRDYVSFLRTLPLVTTPGKPKRGEAVRVNDRFQVEDPEFARRLWEDTGLKNVVADGDWKDEWGGEVVGLSPNIRIYRYSKGQYFDCHYDDSNMITLPQREGPPLSTKTTWTLLLYLTSAAEGCKGGETVFYTHDRQTPSEEIAVPLETGMLLLHKHGDDCLLHEGREVLEGEKWVLRTDICVRRQ
ncbi:uncharacterized protein F5Z01DRAFT_212429 [Emericellopsis atlantica]|uniref:Fe2OG dioxygenase domain-containing protein n=1 Tax=Emericellopsis atlantica TaxID=2614577 RepID=A0A9P7ZVX9_9HYPO|nr:uncharacterized protein F5Z01DRAFT_212429 [Emericellopsis atlantica]KAG9258707.1 hypothetical protein F5Z01DRAFT_212429 [Emericellopsis atlantica]